MTPNEVLDMFFETGVLVSRRSGIGMDQNINYKAIQAIQNSMAQDLVALANDLQNSKQALRDITGLNELTDGSTPNPKTLVPVANLANESTNNALYPYINARRNLVESLAKATIQRLQTALQRGPYDGFNKKAGKWISIPKSIADFDYDIMIEDKATDDQKQWLYELVREDIANKLLTTGDVITIINTYNMKDAQIVLSYRAKKAQDKIDAQAQANTQATTQAQIQSNQAAEKQKLDNDYQRHVWKMQEDDNVQSWMYMTAKLKTEQADNAVTTKAVTDIVTSMGTDGGGGVAPQPMQGMPAGQ